MNVLDITRIVIDRTWKPLLTITLVVAAIIASFIWVGAAGTFGLLLFAAVFALVWFKGAEIYVWATTHALVLGRKIKDKTLDYWNPLVDDIKGELKAVSTARAKLSEAKEERKYALEAVKHTRKEVKNYAKTAAKALQVQLITAGNGEDATEAATAAIIARSHATAAVYDAREALKDLDKANAFVAAAEKLYRNASETYRNSKSGKPVTS